jgi:hypothetical protein
VLISNRFKYPVLKKNLLGYFANFLATVSGGRLAIDPRFTNAPYIWIEAGSKVDVTGFYRNMVPCGEELCGAYLDVRKTDVCFGENC